MRKQELVQLHALCSTVRDYVERRDDLPDDAFERYDRLDVPPMAIDRTKEAHEEALDRLLPDLATALSTHVEGSSDRPSGATDASRGWDADRRPSRASVADRHD
jgi:hypothetical protein